MAGINARPLPAHGDFCIEFHSCFHTSSDLLYISYCCYWTNKILTWNLTPLHTMPNCGPRPQPAGLQTIPYDVIEGITDCLGIRDVAKLSATSSVLRQHIRSDWIGFLHHRLARQCKGPRALYFVALLECLCRLEPHLTEYNVSQALNTLRECLASGQCATVSNTVRHATDTRILVAICQHMDTIDILVDDFASKIFRTNGPILASEVLSPGPENTP